VNGAEEPVGAAKLARGTLVTSFTPFQPRTFALKLGKPAATVAAVRSQPVTLAYDLAVASNDGTRSAGGFDARGQALAAEMLPAQLTYGGVEFKLAAAGTGTANAVTAKGQTIELPRGRFNRVYVLAASAEGDQKAAFKVGDKPVDVTVQAWDGFIGQWDTRLWETTEEPIPHEAGTPAPPPGAPRTRTNEYGKMVGIRPGFVKTAPVAWFASHKHTADGTNQAYAYAYLFAYALDIPANARTLTLPANDKLRILAVSVAEEASPVAPAQPLYDTLERNEQTAVARR
jgi:alpha-mannosidase